MLNIKDCKVGESILVNNLVFTKQANGKWKSSMNELWEDSFIAYCKKAKTITPLTNTKKSKKVDLEINDSK